LIDLFFSDLIYLMMTIADVPNITQEIQRIMSCLQH